MSEQQMISEFQNNNNLDGFFFGEDSLKKVELLFEIFLEAYTKAVAESQENQSYLSKMMNTVMLNNRK